MRRFILIAVAVFMFCSGFGLVYADNGPSNIEMIRTRPAEGSYTEVGKLWMSLKAYQEGEFFEIQKEASDLGADAILLIEVQSKGSSLIMTDDKTVMVGVAIKYN